MLFQYLCGFKPVFYSTHSDDEPINFLYYIDGEEYKPKFDYGLAYFELASGQHCVEIVYKDMIQIVVFLVFNIYYLMILIVGIFCFSHFCISKKNNKYYSRKGNCK